MFKKIMMVSLFFLFVAAVCVKKSYAVSTSSGTISPSTGTVSPSTGTVAFLTRFSVAEYGRAATDPDTNRWLNQVYRMSGTTVSKAESYAISNNKVTFFFFVKKTMDLNVYPNTLSPSKLKEKIFQAGDAVFFSGTPWYGSAVGYADSYEIIHR